MPGHWFSALLKETLHKWWADNALRLSAALSYYTLFSIAPLLTIAVGVAGFVVDTTLVEQEMRGQLAGLLGAESAAAIEGMVHSTREPTTGLIATILSLRTKDTLTSVVAPRLFAAADTPAAMLTLDEARIAELIYPVGFYRTKAKSIRQVCALLIERHDGQVPADLDALLALPGWDARQLTWC